MKKIIVTGATILMALIMAAPSFAIETKVTGTFTLDGVLDSNPGMASDDDDKETISYREMQLRINTETKINDKITFYTRFDILDKLLSSQNSNSINENAEDDDNIQFDHAWMRIISPIGLFQVGRKTGVKWGTDFFDDGNAYGTDRAEYIVPIDVGEDKFLFVAVGEKALETRQTNRDNDKFYLTGTYVNKNWKTGLLMGLYSYNSFLSDNYTTAVADKIQDAEAAGAAYIMAGTLATLAPTANTVALATAAQAEYTAASAAVANAIYNDYKPRIDGQVIYIAPYFSGKAGPLKINAEFGYITGEAQLKGPNSELLQFVTNNLGSAAAGQLQTATSEKKDVKAMCLWLEAGLPMDKANIELGYAYLSGDKNGFSGDIEFAGFLGQGEDWEKMLILTSDNTGLDTMLGGTGNILEINSPMNVAGMSLMYVGGSYNVTDSITLGGIFGAAKADEAMAGWKDDYGMEMDLKLGIKFMGNLEYNAVAGYLMSGDFWKQGGTTKVDDVVALYHEIVLSF